MTKEEITKRARALTRVSNQELSTTELEKLFGLGRDTIRKYLQDAGVEPTKSTGNQTLYKLGDAAEAIPKQMGRESSSDRRNLALAIKAEVETANMLRKNIPIEEIMDPFNVVLNMLNTLVQESDMEEDRKELFFDRRDSLLDELREKYPDAA